MSIQPKYPIYVISKGRSDTCLTPRALDRMNIAYNVVIEPQEYEQYSAVIDPEKILTLPFSNLQQGSIPARNWVWDHAAFSGADRHWILDDNIGWFARLNQNSKHRLTDGSGFVAMEDFVDRYLNVAMAGPNYRFLVKQRQKVPPFYLNGRIYSCILLANAISHRWRGRYNEDTDLSLRILKAGYCTVLFNAFLIAKQMTMTMKGGNTDELYRQDETFDGRLEMARSLQRQHPDVVKITRKWGRWQHHVDYRPFKGNRLIYRDDYVPAVGVNNYGMKLVTIS